tara:strand:+ start:43 stop:789 length:747 start_codon:yes stop_codon:yes gene_type:complete
MKILIVMPFYNEEEFCYKYTEEIINEFSKTNNEINYLLIDDYSADNTHKELIKIKNLNNSTVILKKNDQNLGHGESVVSGYIYSLENNYDAVMQIDGDNAAEPKSMIKLLNYSVDNNFDVVLANRVNRPDNLIRKLITYILFLNLRVIYGVTFKDSNVGIRFMKKEFLEKINLESIKNLSIPNAFITSFSFLYGYNFSFLDIQMRNNIQKNRIGEQWGSGNSLKSLIRLFNGAYKCFLEVNTKFKEII